MSSAMEQLYQQVILDHSRQRQGEGEIDPFDAESFQVNPTCGDEARLRVRLAYDGENNAPLIADLGWTGRGCSISQASLSVLHELVAGKEVSQADRFSEVFRELMHNRGKELTEDKQEFLEDASAFVGVAKYPARVKCALLGWMALRDAVAQALVDSGIGDSQ